MIKIFCDCRKDASGPLSAVSGQRKNSQKLNAIGFDSRRLLSTGYDQLATDNGPINRSITKSPNR
jgi:hypothetical protein